MYPARKEKVDDSGFLKTSDRLPGLCGLCEVGLIKSSSDATLISSIGSCSGLISVSVFNTGQEEWAELVGDFAAVAAAIVAAMNVDASSVAVAKGLMLYLGSFFFYK
jgi:hypothetical protein